MIQKQPNLNLILSIGGVLLLLFISSCVDKNKTGKVDELVVRTVGEIDSVAASSLGRKLFFDKRLSSDNTISCASCHIPSLAFTDGEVLSNGVGGGKTMRNSPTLLNVFAQTSFMFDGEVSTLEMQSIIPIQEHAEMNMRMADLILKLSKIDEYNKAALRIYNREMDPWVLTRSISAFERTLISLNSPFDKFIQGDEEALNSNEKNGWRLFSEELNCIICHRYPYFSDFSIRSNGITLKDEFDKGRFRITSDSTDIGKFKIPTLRNIALTAPYMHNGSFASLYDVLEHYNRGGENTLNKDPLITPLKLQKEEMIDIEAFLLSLTDTLYMIDY